MRRKKNSYKGLAEIDVLINDTKHDSQYFKISNFPDQITSGKNYFNIKGNAKLLEPGSVIEVEVMPENGTEPIFHEVHRYLDDALRRVVTIYGYPEYMTGLATVSIVGVAKYRGGGRLISPNWRGKRNVRWQGNLYIDPLKTNVTDIIFLKQPRITINEHVKSHLSESFVEGPGGDKTIIYNSNPSAQATASNYSTAHITFQEVWSTAGRFGNMPIYEFVSSEPLFSSSMVHGTLAFPQMSLMVPWRTPYDAGSGIQSKYYGIIPTPPVGQSGNQEIAFMMAEVPQFRMDGSNNRNFKLTNTEAHNDYTASIIEVVNSTKVRVDKKWGMDYVISESAGLGPNPQRAGYDPPLVSVQKAYDPTSWTTKDQWKLTYQGPPETRVQDSYNYHSYANLIIANLDPIAGDVHRIKIWMRSHGVGTWDLLADENVESSEMFDDETDVYSYKRMGVFRSQSICDDYWTGSYWIPSASWDLNYAGVDTNDTGWLYDLFMSPVTKSDSEALMDGMIISGSENLRWAQQSFGNQAYGQEAIDHRNESFMFVMPKQCMQVYKGCE